MWVHIPPPQNSESNYKERSVNILSLLGGVMTTWWVIEYRALKGDRPWVLALGLSLLALGMWVDEADLLFSIPTTISAVGAIYGCKPP